MMLRRSPTSSFPPHRGAILLVVLTLLALFAVIGLSFVLYAESEATAARIAKDALSNDGKLPDTIQSVNGVMGQILYPNASPNSAFYGHDFARLVYGSQGNESPYNGHGVYEEAFNMPWLGLPATGPGANPLQRTQVINFRPLIFDRLAAPTQRTVIHPDMTYGDGYIVNPAVGPTAGRTATAPHYVGRNAPYTYADRNNIYVAVIDPATGYVVKPSYMSRDLFETKVSTTPDVFAYLSTNNPNWYSTAGYFKILRPRPIDQLRDAELTYLKGQGLYPFPANPTAMQLGLIQNILDGFNTAANAAVPSFKNLFPYPARNPDGDITGDVQNYRYGNNRQANDSLWLDADLPLGRYKGRYLKPMVAPLVIPLDGRVNYNVAGNLRGGTSAAPTPTSNQGFGPGEVNLQTALQTTPQLSAAQLRLFVNERNGNANTVPNPRGSTLAVDQFHGDPTQPTNLTVGTYAPSYAGIDYDGSSITQPTVPTGSFATTLGYDPAGYATQPNSTTLQRTSETTSPGTLFNPYQWTPRSISGGSAAAVGNPYPIVDARRLTGRFSEKSVHTGQTSVGYNFPVLATSLPQHPANTTRALLTPISNRVARPGLAPSFFGPVTNKPTIGTFLNLTPTGLQLVSDGNPAQSLGSVFDLALNTPLTDPTDGHIGGDANGALAAFISNQRAYLQGVNINRPLADYRDPASRPTGAMAATTAWTMDGINITPASSTAATFDRQNLARDIFQRLCIACAAKVYVSGGTFTLPTVTGPGAYSLVVVLPGAPPTTLTFPVAKSEYDAIRYLAQLAANIVDYIDGDDINTPFVWNPIPPTIMAPNASDNPYNTAEYAANFDATKLPERVVFGVEKPRLVINETHGEVANAVADESASSAAEKFEVRFFLELLNPGNTEGIHSPLVGRDGSAAGAAPLVVDGAMAPIACYRVQIYDNGVLVRNELAARTPENVLGGISIAPKLQATFLNAKTRSNFIAPIVATPTKEPDLISHRLRVEPNNGKFATSINVDNMPNPVFDRNGFCVVGPELVNKAMSSNDPAYRPDVTIPNGDPNQNNATRFEVQIPNAGGINQLMYQVTEQDPPQIKTLTLDPLRANGHAVVLQRLACPYLPESASNPYLTVDAMSQVWINDAIRVGKKPAGVGATGDRGAATPTADKNHSTARMAPYAGNQPNTPVVLNPPPAAAPPAGTALTIPQIVNPVPTTTPHESFFRHNSESSTPPVLPLPPSAPGSPPPRIPGLVFPFSAPTQLDRRLVNVAELLHVSVCRQYEVTNGFSTPKVDPNDPTSTIADAYLQELNRGLYGITPLYRLFEVLQTKPWNWGVPHGGRTPGAVNINMLWDEDAITKRSKVFDAVMDPQAGNRFTAADLTPMWNNIKATRTPGWIPGGTLTQQTIRATKFEADSTAVTGKDNPFRGFGTGMFQVAPTAAHVRNVGGIEATMMRRDATSNQPYLATSAFSSDPWVGYEPMRKAFSQLTTTTDAYQVVMTIGYFEVVNPNGTLGGDPAFDVTARAILRREAFNTVPGDLRQQFTSMIDRSNIAKPIGPNDGTTGVPWFTELVQGPIENTAQDNTTPMGKRRYYIRFKATGTNAAKDRIFVNYDGENIILSDVVGAGITNQMRLGSGPNAETITIRKPGARIQSVPSIIDLPTYEPSTGLATIMIEYDTMTPPSGPQFRHHPGEAITGGYIPGHPGNVPFDVNNPAFRGVVRFFSRLTP